MKLFIVVFFTCLSLIKASTQQDWYKTQLDTLVLPPLGEAHRILRVRVLNELASVNIALLTDAAVTQLANRLLCAARDVRTSLDQSVVASDQLRNQMDSKVMISTAQVGTYEQNIVNKESEIHQTNQYLSGAQMALASAEQAVRDKEANVRNAEQALSAAEDVVEKARKCHGFLGIGKRSDSNIPSNARGWFSSITRPIIRPIENAIKDVIIKPVCSVINMGPVDAAKNRRNDAYGQLQRARDQVVECRQSVANHQARKASLETQLIQLRSDLGVVRVALEVLQDELVITVNINTQLKKAGTQISSVHAGSIVLQSAVTNMIDFDQVLTPLNAIYMAIGKITAIDTAVYIPPAQIQQAQVHLAQIAVLVPNIPFNMNTDLVCV